jgi:hypothetical protein
VGQSGQGEYNLMLSFFFKKQDRRFDLDRDSTVQGANNRDLKLRV